MKAISLLLLRITTGLLLVIWGLIKIGEPDEAIGVSNKYYDGLLSAADLQTALGAGEIALGALVILGLLRAISYTLQFLVLALGAAAIWEYIADPLGLYLMTRETREVLFFPSTTVVVAALILLVFRNEDTITLDRVLFKR